MSLMKRASDRTRAVAIARASFLQEAMNIAESRDLLLELFSRDNEQLAEDCFILRRSQQVSPALSERIVQWSIRCRLAAGPHADAWWIFDVAVATMKSRVLGSGDEGDAEDSWAIEDTGLKDPSAADAVAEEGTNRPPTRLGRRGCGR